MNRSCKLYIAIIALFLFFLLNCQAGFTATDSLFELPLNARNLGTGKASVCLSNGRTGFFFNHPKGKEPSEAAISSLYANQFGELHYAAFDIRSRNVGLSYRRLGTGGLIERDLRGNSNGKSFQYYSQGLVGRIGGSFGPTFLSINSQLLQKGTGDGFLGWSLSPEFIYKISPFSFSAVMSNLVTGEMTPSEDDPSPWSEELTFGFGFDQGNFEAGFDVEAEFHDRGVEPNGFRAGMEWWIKSFAAIRLGVMDKLRHTVGWGIRGENIQIDYAYLRHDELPNSHFVSFSWFI